MLIIGCLTACNFSSNISSSLHENAESSAKAEKMINALAENRIEDARDMMHSNVVASNDDALNQMIDYLDGRDADSMEPENINISSSVGTSGKIRQESVVYKVTLTDNSVIRVKAIYLSDSSDSGFIAFQISLGVV